MLFPLIVSSTQHLAGDVAPLGDPDGQLNVADVLILERFILSQVSPTAEELLVTDVAPLGAPDGLLNAADLVVSSPRRLPTGTLTLSKLTIRVGWAFQPILSSFLP